MKNANQMQLPEHLLVHPGLTYDPVGKQGHIGVLTAAIWNSDEFFVGFDDKVVGLYSADALLALRQPEDIHDYLRHNASSLSVDDFKDLKNIALLTDRGTAKHLRAALELVQGNRKIQDAATICLDELIGLKQRKGLKR